MAMRYFKATNGSITVFRASQSKVYQSASGFGPREMLSFSGKPGPHPCTEIDKAEYNRLVAIKNARANSGSPQDSWVKNEELT